MPTNTKQIKQALLRKRERPAPLKEAGLSTGSTMLNLACTDHPGFGFRKGGYYYIIGDSASGKTWTSLSCFAEACLRKQFKDYRLIFDDVEGGALMSIEEYFGSAVANRMELPGEHCSETVEDFYYNITDAIKAGRPFIYVLDSQDALGSTSQADKFNKQKSASREGGESAGSYGDGKAKYHSENIRHVLSGLRRTGSILIIIGQTRDNLGFGFEKKTRAGGKALRFYANLEIWTSVGKKITRTVRGKPRTIGVRCLAQVKKNRVTGKTGKDREVEIPIYYDFGIDDMVGCVDYLISEQHWTQAKKGNMVNAPDIMFEGSRAKLLDYIESEGLHHKVRLLAGKVWRQIENETRTHRKKRYE